MINNRGKGRFIFQVGLAISMRTASFSEFFPGRFVSKLEAAKDIRSIFQVVTQAVHEQMGMTRSGLELGLVELEDSQGRFIGCLHPMGTNQLLVNKLPLQLVRQTSPSICRSYLFVILLHEYLHTFGIWDEKETTEGGLAMIRQVFGDEHPATKLAEDIEHQIPFVTYPKQMSLPPGKEIEPL
jgi:hypothetical protein